MVRAHYRRVRGGRRVRVKAHRRKGVRRRRTRRRRRRRRRR